MIWRWLFTENPAMVEVKLARERMKPKNWKSGPAVMYSVLAICALGLAYILASSAAGLDPFYMFYPMMVLVALLVPIYLHGVVAGERQARSLELLYAAPVTPEQILAGKAMRGIPAALAVILYFGGMMVLLAIVRTFVPQTWGMHSEDTVTVFSYLAGFVGVAGVVVFSLGVALWVSSRAKTTGAALLGTIGSLTFVYVVVPMIMLSFLALIEPEVAEALFAGHPIGFLAWATDMFGGRVADMSMLCAGIGLAVWYAGGFVLMGFAVARMRQERREGVETR